MANNVTPIVEAQLVPAAAGALHSASGTQKIKVTGAVCADQGTAASTLTVWLVPVSGARANGNRIIKDKAFTASQSIILKELIGRVLKIGTVIHAQATAGTDLTIQIDGVYFTDPT